jgi:hypothetical protein
MHDDTARRLVASRPSQPDAMNGEQRAKRRSAYDRLPIKEFGGQNVSIYFSCRLPWLR